MASETLTVDGHEIHIENAGKVLFPDDGITKLALARYYEKIAPHMLPYLKDRPITENRFPNGITGENFYQKDAPAYYPDWIKRAPEKKVGGVTNYVVADSAATLAYLASQACITMHLWLSREDKPEFPDMIVFDLDPPSTDFEPVRRTAFMFRDFFEKLGVQPFVKTTGSKGVHVTIPLDRTAPFEDARTFAHDVALYLAGRDPEHLTVEVRKEKRGNRVFLDVARNSYAQTAVAPFSVRAIPKASVATPLTWEELADPGIKSRSYNISNIFDRLKKDGDPWKGLWKKTYNLTEMRKKFEGIK